ncbi:MAG TPA: GNAT family protein [Allosphingosinicella sp.]|nr:GNAT family protein [Allosphingosinicella sp.]
MIFAESERLILRRPKREDYEAFLRSWDDPEMTRYTNARPNVSRFISDLIEEMQTKQPGESDLNGPWYQFSIERRDNSALVGDIGIGFGVPGERQVEIGYRIHPDHHRRGYAREAVAAIIDYLIAEHGIHRFVGVAAAPNAASIALLRSLGFRQEGYFKESFLCNGEWLDDAYYALLASEWKHGRR